MERRVRTFWVVRKRYRWAGRVSAGVGGSAALALVAAIALQQHSAGMPIGRSFVLQSALLVALGVLLPLVVTNLLWRRYRLRHYEDIG